jgi:hypothetical protein
MTDKIVIVNNQPAPKEHTALAYGAGVKATQTRIHWISRRTFNYKRYYIETQQPLIKFREASSK